MGLKFDKVYFDHKLLMTQLKFNPLYYSYVMIYCKFESLPDNTDPFK